MLLGEFSVSRPPPLKSRDKSPVPQASAGWRSEIWQLLVRGRAGGNAQPWVDQLTTDWILILFVVAGNLGEATVPFWGSNASFGKMGPWHLIESVPRTQCHIPDAWQQLSECRLPLLPSCSGRKVVPHSRQLHSCCCLLMCSLEACGPLHMGALGFLGFVDTWGSHGRLRVSFDGRSTWICLPSLGFVLSSSIY